MLICLILLLIKYKYVVCFYLLHEEPCNVNVTNKPLLSLLLLLLLLLESSLLSVILKKSNFFLISSVADSNLFLTQLMLRCSSKTFFRCSLRNLVKVGNILLSGGDKFLFDFCLDLEIEFLLTVSLCQINFSVRYFIR